MVERKCFGIAVVLGLALHEVQSFAPCLHPVGATQSSRVTTHVGLSDPKIEVIVGDDDEEDLVAPNNMRVSEIKAELNLRGIDYTDCFDKESLAARLDEARATGEADPKIIEKFNKQKIESVFSEEKVEMDDSDIEAAVATDGTLPGGLTPDQFKMLTGNPEIMALLQSTKMQEAMSLMMTGGRDELEKKLKEDPELQETVQKLDEIMKGLQ